MYLSFLTSITPMFFTKMQINDHKNNYNHDTGTKLGHLIVVFNKNINLLFFKYFGHGLFSLEQISNTHRYFSYY